jgi:outer membrane protein OmpA-like peptidoglycan-associated protein
VTVGNIRKGMQVLDHRGTLHGTVDAVEAGWLQVVRRGIDGLQGHEVPVTAIHWVDHAVHLIPSAEDSVAAKPAARRPAEFGERRRLRIPLPWFAGLATLALLGLVATQVMHRGAGRAVQGGATGVVLPGGDRITLAPGSVAEDLQRFLASPQPAPRTFTLETLDFAEGGAAVPRGAAGELKAVARILAAYPDARVTVVGYADVPRTAGVAVDVQAAAELGGRRAEALAALLVAGGAKRAAVTALSGNDPANLDKATQAVARSADDRHPELIVTRK